MLVGRQRRVSGATIRGAIDQVTAVALTDSVAVTVVALSVDTHQALHGTLVVEKTDGTRQQWDVAAHHDGTSGGDATATDYRVGGMGPLSPAHTIAVDIDGTGAAQVLRLRVTAAEAGWSAYWLDLSPHT